MRHARLISWVLPVRVAQAEGRHGMLDLTWENGRLVVNSTRANQSHGALHRVWQRAFREAGVVEDPPGSVLLLGLGAGSVVRILREEIGLPAPITAVEDDPVMLAWGRTHFGMERVPDLHVLEGDARIILPVVKERYDLVVVDLFEDLDLPAGTADEPFLEAVMACLAPGGRLLWNTIAHDLENTARARSIEAFLSDRAARTRSFRTEAINTVFIAQAPDRLSDTS